MCKKILLILSLTFMVSTVGAQHQNSKHYPEIKLGKIQENRVDTFLTKGLVKLIFKCPPCPEGAQCKPCIGDHVEVTDGNKENDIRVFTDQLSFFKTGSFYLFLVHFRNKFHRADNVELVRVLE